MALTDTTCILPLCLTFSQGTILLQPQQVYCIKELMTMLSITGVLTNFGREKKIGGAATIFVAKDAANILTILFYGKNLSSRHIGLKRTD